MSGYWATGRPIIATAPVMTMRMAITIATIGRPTKKRDIAQRSAVDEPEGDGAADAEALSDAGTACTDIPGLMYARMETITLSPALTPCSTTDDEPTCPATETGRNWTLPSAPTTATR